ncbi:MAG: hypothetical protein IPL36_03820 [Nigerium sp.]|nr:hypothetical protein [Nigerium sp.]
MTAKQQRLGSHTEALANNRLTYADDTPSAPAVTTDGAKRCLACSRRLSDPRSIAEGFGPICRRREENRQRTERTTALRARLWSLLAWLPDLEVDALTRLADALDDLDTIGGAR